MRDARHFRYALRYARRGRDARRTERDQLLFRDGVQGLQVKEDILAHFARHVDVRVNGHAFGDNIVEGRQSGEQCVPVVGHDEREMGRRGGVERARCETGRNATDRRHKSVGNLNIVNYDWIF